jgi:hypothetical protein
MARAVHVASADTEVAAVGAGSNTVVGFTVAAGAATVVRLRHGDDVADPVIAVAQLGGAGSVHVQIPAVNVDQGVFVERTVAAEVVLYLL